MDYTLFALIHQFAGKSAMLDSLMIILAEWLLYLIVGGVIIWYFVLVARHKKSFVPLYALLAGVVGKIIEIIFDSTMYFPRPFVVLGENPLVLMNAADSSFPSGHMSFLLAIAFFVFWYYRRLGWVLIILSALVGIARIYAGVHWPLDIVAGACVGILAAWITRRVGGSK